MCHILGVRQLSNANTACPQFSMLAPPLDVSLSADHFEEHPGTRRKAFQMDMGGYDPGSPTEHTRMQHSAQVAEHIAKKPSRVSCSVSSCESSQFELHFGGLLYGRRDPFPAPWNDGTPSVEVLAGLGQGGFANVMLVSKPQHLGSHSVSTDQELFAMKVVSKVDKPRPKDQRRMANELAVMRDTLPSRFLERCHAAFESATDVFFVCDYLAGGDFFHHMVQRIKDGKGAFTELEYRTILAEVTLGLQHLHARGFIHRDLKVENLMLDASGHIKIIDFGLAVAIAEGEESQPLSPTGSVCYMAPEMIKKVGLRTGGRHTDWWAMGVLAYEVLTARSPWSTLTDRTVIRHEIEHCKVVLPPSSHRTASRTKVSKEGSAFVERLLERNYLHRLGTGHDEDVKAHAFFRNVDWPAMERGQTPPAFTIDRCGPAAVDQKQSKTALDKYAAGLSENSEPSHPRASFKQVGNFGVRSPWFLGVDVVTSHPRVAGF